MSRRASVEIGGLRSLVQGYVAAVLADRDANRANNCVRGVYVDLNAVACESKQSEFSWLFPAACAAAFGAGMVAGHFGLLRLRKGGGA